MGPGVVRRSVAALVVVGWAAAVAAGALGQEFRWLGVLALTEFALGRLLWRWGWLAARPWRRLALRLGAGAGAVAALGLPMPPAAVVGWLFVLSGVLGLLWAAALCASGAGSQAAACARLCGLCALVGLWFQVLGVPSTPWAPVVVLLAAQTAIVSRRDARLVAAQGQAD